MPSTTCEAAGAAGARRRAGVLLHPTSLPGPHGIGDLGAAGAGASSTWLAAAGQSVWQVLPLAPTGYGDSPYQALSAFAGNPLLISPERARGTRAAGRGRAGRRHAVPARARSTTARCRRGRPAPAARGRALRGSEGPASRREAARARSARARRAWLEDYALFLAAEGRDTAARPGPAWEPPLAAAETAARSEAWRRRAARDELHAHAFAQFVFDRQWRACARAAARARHRDHGRPPHLRGARQRRRLGPPGALPPRRATGGRRRWPACRPTTSAPPASSGATRSTTGRRRPRPATPGGSRACAPNLAPRRPRAPRPLPRLRGLLGGAGGRRRPPSTDAG